MASDDDCPTPPPGWPGEAEINEEVNKLYAQHQDLDAMSAMLDAQRREQDAAEQQGERDQQDRLDQVTSLASEPGALPRPGPAAGLTLLPSSRRWCMPRNSSTRPLAS